MAGRSRALFASRNVTKRHDLAFLLAISEIGCTFKKKYHSESGLYQRDEDPHEFSVTQVPMSPRENSLSGGVGLRALPSRLCSWAASFFFNCPALLVVVKAQG